MSRTFESIDGLAIGGSWLGNLTEEFGSEHLNKIRDDFLLAALGQYQKNPLVGGSFVVGIDASSSGDVDLPDWLPFEIDNALNQLSGSSLTMQFRLRAYVRVSNAAISFTPKLLYGTDGITFGSTASLSGAAACSATNSDYSGTNQVQTITFTPTNAKSYFKVKGTIAGTPAAGYQAWMRVLYDCYVDT